MARREAESERERNGVRVSRDVEVGRVSGVADSEVERVWGEANHVHVVALIMPPLLLLLSHPIDL